MELSYFNARVRGLRGRLLGAPDYETLLKSDGTAGYLDRLKSTAYGRYVEASGARFDRPDEIISSALKANLVETFSIVRGIAPEKAMPFLKALLSILEVYDLKALLRGIARGVKREEIMNALIPAGEFDTAALNMLIGSKNIQDLVSFLETWANPYAKPLRAGLPAYVKNGSIMEMELNLDLFIFGTLLQGLERRSQDSVIMREALILRIDACNLITLLKIAGEGYTDEAAAGFFIDGGRRIDRALFLTLSSMRDRDEVIERLASGIKDADLKKILASVDMEEPCMIEERLDSLIESRLSRTAVVEPLSIALSASFIYMKLREVKNLRLINMGKAFGMPEEEIKRLIIYPR